MVAQLERLGIDSTSSIPHGDLLLCASPEISRERFSTPFVEVCPVQIYGVDTNNRLHQLGSLARENLLQGMVPNTLVCFDQDGNPWFADFAYPDLYLFRDDQRILFGHAEEKDGSWVLKDFDAGAVDFTEAAWVVAVGAWGSDIDLMYINWNKSFPTAINDIPDYILVESLRQQASIIKELLQEGRPVCWGVNNSAGTLHGRGLMSVLYPHIHIWRFGSHLNDLTPEEIKTVRRTSLWDEGLSTGFGNEVATEFRQQTLYKYWNCAELEIDNMGFTIKLPGYTPDELAELSFMRDFWELLSWKIDDKLKAFHRRHFNSDLGEIYEFVRVAHRSGQVDEETFKRFFQPREGSFEGEEGQLLKRLSDAKLLRYPPGWAGGIQFTKEGAFVSVTFGFLDVPMGPVEGMGVELRRPKDQKLSKEEMARKAEMYEYLVRESLEIHH